MTARRRFVAYYRQQQGRSGLGLAAQQEAVHGHVSSVAGELVDAFEEVKTGKLNARPALAQALAACRAMHATLIIAKLDRLARNAAFLLSVVEGSGQGAVVFCDLPQVPPGPSGKFVIAIMAAVAELEAGLISERTKAALAQAKARGGVRLGNPRLQPGTHEQALHAAAAKRRQAADRAAQVRPYVEAARKAGCTTLAQLAAALNARGVRTARGGPWHASSVWRVLERDAGASAAPLMSTSNAAPI
jgi:DNA invertase Pin-like site-specific DNA recombinase